MIEQDLCDSRCGDGDAGKTEQCRYQRNDEKNNAQRNIETS